MQTNIVDLYQYFNIKRPDGAKGYLHSYVIEKYDYCPDRVRPAMLVVPGGGYALVSAREAEPVAFKFLAEGYSAFVLDYSVEPIAFPYQLIEGCMAVAYIRDNAEKFGIDPGHVGAVGFSAGGHLTAMLATMYNEKEVVEFLKDKSALCRPDAVILSYPVISSDENISHLDSILRLSGKDGEIIQRISLEKRVDKNSSPAYIWTTVNDATVPMENSFVMAKAYKEAGVPFELHVFENGMHGLSVSTEEVAVKGDMDISSYVREPIQAWIKGSLLWLKERGFRIKI